MVPPATAMVRAVEEVPPDELKLIVVAVVLIVTLDDVVSLMISQRMFSLGAPDKMKVWAPPEPPRMLVPELASVVLLLTSPGPHIWAA